MFRVDSHKLAYNCVHVCRQADQLDKLNRIARDCEQPASHLFFPVDVRRSKSKTKIGTAAVYKETGSPNPPVLPDFMPNSRTRNDRYPPIDAGGACCLIGKALPESNSTLQIDGKQVWAFGEGDVTPQIAEQRESGGKDPHHVASLADCLISFKLSSSSSLPLRQNMSESNSVGSTVRVDPVWLSSRPSDDANAGRSQVEEGRGARTVAAAVPHESAVTRESVGADQMGEWARREQELLQSLKVKWRNRSSA